MEIEEAAESWTDHMETALDACEAAFASGTTLADLLRVHAAAGRGMEHCMMIRYGVM